MNSHLKSFWTTPSNNPANYWENVNETPLPSGDCSATTEWSDSPDGPVVEKGGAAEVIRKGNNPPTTRKDHHHGTRYVSDEAAPTPETSKAKWSPTGARPTISTAGSSATWPTASLRIASSTP